MLALEFTLYSQPPRTVYGWRGITKRWGILNRVAPLTLHSAYLCRQRWKRRCHGSIR
jgi:hypothetical protein